MIEFIIASVFVLLVVFWLAYAIAGVIVAVPVLAVVGAGAMLGLNWWQSMIAVFVAFGVVMAAAEERYARHFREHAEGLGLSPDDLKRTIEVEGRLATIIGSTSGDVVVRRKDRLFASRLDPKFVRSKLG